MAIGQVTDVNGTSPETTMLEAAAARSKGDAVRISTGGSTGASVDLTIADDTNVYRIAVATSDMASGDVGAYVTKGTVKVTVPSASYDAGDGFTITNGVLASSSSAADDQSGEVANTDWGVILVGGTTVTEITVTLHGFACTATT